MLHMPHQDKNQVSSIYLIYNSKEQFLKHLQHNDNLEQFLEILVIYLIKSNTLLAANKYPFSTNV